MALFASPEEHMANPPETWEVVKRADRVWWLRPAGADYCFDSFPTRKAALRARESGFYVRLWHEIATEHAWTIGEYGAALERGGWQEDAKPWLQPSLP